LEILYQEPHPYSVHTPPGCSIPPPCRIFGRFNFFSFQLYHLAHLTNRFPPRSGPSPGDTKLVMQPPSAPSSPKLESSAPACAHVSDKSEARTRHVKYASIDPVYRKENTSASKTHARRRTERDEPHSLLTPPLTPSSSIRTSASRDSGAESVAAQQGLDDDKDETRTTSEEVVDSDPESTRILLVSVNFLLKQRPI